LGSEVPTEPFHGQQLPDLLGRFALEK